MKPLNIIGLMFIASGTLLFFGFILYKIIEDIFYDADIPTIIILGIISVISGAIIILISLIIERIKDKKKGE